MNNPETDTHNASGHWLDALGRIGGVALCSFVFGLLNFVISSQLDLELARRLGGVQPITSGIFTGGESYGGIDWTVTSFWGPLMSVGIPPVGMILGMMFVGVAIFELFRALFFSDSVNWRQVWLWVGLNLALWMLRFPVPIEYSLFYWTAIKY